MRNSLAAPWYERHKSLLALLSALSAVAGVLGFIFRADLRPVFAAILAPMAATWRWLWTFHSAPGWLWALLVLTALPGLWLCLQAATSGPKQSQGHLVLEGVRWEIWFSGGKILGMPVPYCPDCQCQIAPVHRGPDGKMVTIFRCEDCDRADQVMEGHLTVVLDSIARRIEAQWRRGKLPTSRRGFKKRPGSTVGFPPCVAARLEDQP